MHSSHSYFLSLTTPCLYPLFIRIPPEPLLVPLPGSATSAAPADSYITSCLSNRQAKQTMLHKAFQRNGHQQTRSIRSDLQQRRHAHYPHSHPAQLQQDQQQHYQQSKLQQRKLQQAHEEFNRQRQVHELQNHFSRTGIKQSSEQERPIGGSRPISLPTPPPTSPTSGSMPGSWPPLPTGLSEVEGSNIHNYVSPVSHPYRRPTPPMPGHQPHSSAGWTSYREKEQARFLANVAQIGGVMPAAAPVHIARENFRRLSQRIQHRRARARETILYDLHQGVKSVEAQVQKQVEMVLSRLKDAPGSRYAFALTNSFLAQIPSTISGSLLPASIVPLPESTDADLKKEEAEESLVDRRDKDALTDESELGVQQQRQQQPGVSISSAGASEFLSASMHPSYTRACSQVLSAALPSFIPSVVAPLVCVFSYPMPSSYSMDDDVFSLKPLSAAESSNKEPKKEFVYPWGLPDRCPEPAYFYTNGASSSSSSSSGTRSGSTSGSSKPGSSCSSNNNDHNDNDNNGSNNSNGTNVNIKSEVSTVLNGIPDPGIVVVHSNAWTQAEREALYLAATRLRLSGQWSKIREMMNLHRTDEEIEAEYTKLYGHRGQDLDDEDNEAEDDDTVMDSDKEFDETEVYGRYHSRPQGYGRAGNRGDADDIGTDSPVFMRFGGGGSGRGGEGGGGGGGREGEKRARDEIVAGARQYFYPPEPVPAEPLRLYKKELLIDKRFELEEIPMRL
ncbi:hypothetical protein BGW38_010232 [Lunasporangiospora selenospora]|uniref:Myb-like domain-containing protein n=1 Tax=Lunasporangiospora selenospora TaxID=979761 RepID=A0A9P6KFL8_9FUNG|nr:hypothetical protein BGW38_010232 [Lunasporangiospora selenospora]